MSWLVNREAIKADISASLNFIETYAGDIIYSNLTSDENTVGIDGIPDHTVKVYGAVIVENAENVDKAHKRTVNYIVVDEGLAGEKAQYMDEAKKEQFPVTDAAKKAILDYVRAFPTYKGHHVIIADTSSDFKFAKIIVWLQIDDHIEEKLYMIFKDGASAINHSEITVTI